MIYCSSHEQAADVLTKALRRGLNENMRNLPGSII